MIRFIPSALSNERCAFFAFATLSALALAAAFISQYVYGLQPCVLCIYQRWPFAVVIALCIMGLWFGRKSASPGPVFLGLTAATLAANTGIAFYHTGVERHWWESFLEGCTVPSMEGNITDVMARIAATPAARCDEIPWTDPLLGLSMANYNVVLCLVLTLAALYALIHRRKNA